MTIPEDVAEGLAARAVGAMMLVSLDTTEGFVRLILGEDGYIVDTSGNKWVGSQLLSMGEVESNLNGKAPAWEFSCSYTYDPDREDLISAVRSYGVDAINGRPAKVYLQYFGKHEEMLAPLYAPILLSTSIMRKLNYEIEGDTSRIVRVTCEGPYSLRGRPVNGRYTDGDQRRRADGDPSLEFMPNNTHDDEPLFGA